MRSRCRCRFSGRRRRGRYKIAKPPGAVDQAQTGAVAFVIRVGGHLRGGHHVIGAGNEALPEHRAYFGPEIVNLPVLENPRSLASGAPAKAEIRRHHAREDQGIVLVDGFAQTGQKCLESDVTVLIRHGRTAGLGDFVLLLLFAQGLATGEGHREQ